MNELVILDNPSSGDEISSSVQAAPLTTDRIEISKQDTSAVQENVSTVNADVVPIVDDSKNSETTDPEPNLSAQSELLEEGASGSQSSTQLNDDTTDNEPPATSTSTECSSDIDENATTELNTVSPPTDQMEVDEVNADVSTLPDVLCTAVDEKTHETAAASSPTIELHEEPTLNASPTNDESVSCMKQDNSDDTINVVRSPEASSCTITDNHVEKESTFDSSVRESANMEFKTESPALDTCKTSDPDSLNQTDSDIDVPTIGDASELQVNATTLTTDAVKMDDSLHRPKHERIEHPLPIKEANQENLRADDVISSSEAGLQECERTLNASHSDVCLSNAEPAKSENGLSETENNATVASAASQFTETGVSEETNGEIIEDASEPKVPGASLTTSHSDEVKSEEICASPSLQEAKLQDIEGTSNEDQVNLENNLPAAKDKTIIDSSTSSCMSAEMPVESSTQPITGDTVVITSPLPATDSEPVTLPEEQLQASEATPVHDRMELNDIVSPAQIETADPEATDSNESEIQSIDTNAVDIVETENTPTVATVAKNDETPTPVDTDEVGVQSQTSDDKVITGVDIACKLLDTSSETGSSHQTLPKHIETEFPLDEMQTEDVAKQSHTTEEKTTTAAVIIETPHKWEAELDTADTPMSVSDKQESLPLVDKMQADDVAEQSPTTEEEATTAVGIVETSDKLDAELITLDSGTDIVDDKPPPQKIVTSDSIETVEAAVREPIIKSETPTKLQETDVIATSLKPESQVIIVPPLPELQPDVECRICGSDTAELSPIFENEAVEDTVPLVHKIESTFSTVVSSAIQLV